MAYDSHLVVSDFTTANLPVSKGSMVGEGQSNEGFMTSGGHDSTGKTTGYHWQSACSDLATLLGFGSSTFINLAAQPGYLSNPKFFTVIAATPTFDVENLSSTPISAYQLNPTPSGNTFTDPSTWPLGYNGTAYQGAVGLIVGTLPSDGLAIYDRVHDEYDSRGSDLKMSFYARALLRELSFMMRGTQTLPDLRQPVFFGSSAFLENTRAVAVADILAAQLALVNSGKNYHFLVGNAFDCVDRNDLSHMDETGDFNFQARALFQRARILSQLGFGTTNVHQWIIGLGARIGGWTSPAAKVGRLNIIPDRNDDIEPPVNFNPACFSIQDGATSISCSAIHYVNSTTFDLTLSATPSSAATLTYCASTGFFGVGSLPTCNFWRKTAYFPASARAIMSKWLQVGVPIQRLDEPLLRDKTANINADNKVLGNVTINGKPIIGGPGGSNTPVTLSISTIADAVAGADLTLSGGYGGTPPTGFTYTINAGSKLTAVLPTISGGLYSFKIPNAELPVGSHTVVLTEANNVSVSATSNSFVVSAPIMNTGTTLTPIPAGWVQAFVDTFPGVGTYSGTIASTGLSQVKWGQIYDNATIYQGGNATLHLASNVLVNSGLKLRMVHDNNTKITGPNAGWSGASISTVTKLAKTDAGNNTTGGFAMNGGLVICKGVKYTRAPGVNPVILLWPEDQPWPEMEIDFIEDFNTNPTFGVGWLSNNHYLTGTTTNNQQTLGPFGVDPTKATVEIAMLWQPALGKITIYGNGVVQGTFTTHVPPAQFAYIGLSLYTYAYGAPPSTTNTPSPNDLTFSSVEAWIDQSSMSVRGPGAYVDTGNSATPPAKPPSTAITVTVTQPSPFYVSTAYTFTGTISQNVPLALSWLTTGTPLATDPGWIPATVAADGVFTFRCPGVVVDHAGVQSTLWTLVNGTVVAKAFSATPVDQPVVVVPPSLTIQQPTTLPVGIFNFVVSASGTYKTIELVWGDPVTPPLATDPGWVAVVNATISAPVNVTGGGVPGGLWYRFDGGAPPAQPYFVITPIIPDSLAVQDANNPGLTEIVAGYPLYVSGTWGGTQPPTLAYYVDSGIAGPPAATPYPPSTGSLGLTVWPDVANARMHYQVYKATGAVNTTRAQLDGQYIGVLKDSAVDGNYSGGFPLAAVGSHAASISLDGSTATASASFSVAPAASAIPVAASASITADGFWSFIVPAGLTSGTHTITVVRTDNNGVTAITQSLIVAVATGTPPMVAYPSVQTSVIAPIARPGFNPNLNVLYNNDQFETFWKDPRDWSNTIDLGYAGKGGVPGWRNQPCWRRTIGAYGFNTNYNNWDTAFRVVMSVQARVGSSTIMDIYTNQGHSIFPAGDPFVFWIPEISNNQPTLDTNFLFTGWKLPLRLVTMPIVDSSSTTWTDSTGAPIKDANGNTQTVHKYGIQLPSGTTIPAGFYWDNRAGITAKSASQPILYGRHNSFYIDAQKKIPPWQVSQMLDVAQYHVVQNGGVFVYGGDQGEPVYFDYWNERKFFGDTIAYQFLAGEMEYVGGRLRAFPDHTLIAIEPENEPTGPWTNLVNGVENGVKDMIVNFQIPGWRKAVGPDITILVKGTAYGSLAWALQYFDVVFPNDGPYGYVAHIYDRSQAQSTVYPDPTKPQGSNYNANSGQMYFTGDGDGKYVADALSTIKARSGATIAGLTEFGVDWNYTQTPGAAYGLSGSNEPYRARMVAHFWEPSANAGHFAMVWGSAGDGNLCAGPYKPDGLTYAGPPDNTTIEVFFPAFRNEAVLANTAASLAGTSLGVPLPAYNAPAINTTPIFRITAQNGPIRVTAGKSVTANIMLGATNAYSGTVAVSASGLPAGVTVSLSSASFAAIGGTHNDNSNVCVATIAVAGTVAVGTYPISIKGADGTTTKTSTLSLVVASATAAPGFTLTPTTSSHSVMQGSSASVVLTLAPTGSYTASDAITIGPLPTGVTATASPTSVAGGSGTTTILFTASGSAAVSTTPVTVTASDGTLSQTATINLAITAASPAPSYTLTPATASLAVAQGGSSSTTLTLAATGGYAGTDTISVGTLPSGVTASLSTASIANGSGSTTVTFSATTGAAIASNPVVVTVTDGSLTRTSTITLVVTAAPTAAGFTLSPSAASVGVAQGASGGTTLTLAATGGYTGTDTLSVGALPSGVTATLSATSIANGSGTSVLTLTASASAAIASTPITITATDGTITQTSTVTLAVSAATPAPSFMLTPASAALPVTQGVSATLTLTLAATGGYTGTDTLTLGALPTGITASLSPTSVINGSGTSTLTVAASSAAVVGPASLTVTASDGTLARTSTISLSIKAPAPTPTFMVTPASTSVTVVQGAASPPVTLTLSNTGGYTGTDMVTVGSLPADLTATVSPTSVANGSGTVAVTFAAIATASTGSVSTVVSITDGSTTQTCVIGVIIAPAVAPATNILKVNPQSPIYTTTNGSFSGSGADPTKSLGIAYLTSGTPSLAVGASTPAMVNSDGTWTVSGVAIDHPGVTSTLWAVIGNASSVALETIVPTNAPAPPVVPVATALKVGPTVVSTDGTGTYTLGCGAVSGGILPYTFQFQRVIYTSGAPGPVQPVGASGSSTTYQDASLPLNSTAGYSVTVTDASTPTQSITTQPVVVTYGTPSGGNVSGGPSLADVLAAIQNVKSDTGSLVTDANTATPPRF